jgi:hypothetical protein
MPLQIRRGTDAERLAMTQPLAQGELLFVTTAGAERLYIGNGSTLGGIQITGYTNEDAQDASATLFSNGVHSGITFTYNDATASLSASVDLSNYNGVINASALQGSIFADDSSVMIDTIDEKIYASNGFFGNLTGNVTGNITGNVTGNVTGNLTGNVDGDVTGSIFADDSSLLVNAIDKSFVGRLDGDVTGSVFSDSSTLLVDGVDGRIVAPVFANVTGNVLATDTSVIIDNTAKTAALTGIALSGASAITGNALFLTDAGTSFVSSHDGTNPLTPTVNVAAFINSATFAPSILIQKSRGSIVSQTIVQNGDLTGAITYTAWDGTQFQRMVSINVEVDGVVTPGSPPPARMDLLVNTSNTIKFRPTSTDFQLPPKLPVVADDTARTALVPTPTTGMMIFMTAGTSPAATNKVQVYDSAAWVNLH